MNITPTNKNVLVLDVKKEKENSSDFELTTNQSLDVMLVKVIAIAENMDGIKPGQEVYVDIHAGKTVEHTMNGTYRLIDMSDILATKN